MASPPVTTTKVVKSRDGTEIYAEATGNPSGPHVVFVHGYACSGSCFDPLWALPSFQKEIYAVRYDSRGHGRSGKPDTAASYETHLIAADFEAVADAFGVKNPFFAGWSLGAAVITDLVAAKMPVAGVIWISPIPYVGDLLSVICSPWIFGLLPQIEHLSDTHNVLASRVEFARALVPPARLADVPYATLSAWIGVATQFPPSIGPLVANRVQDPEPLRQAGREGLPALVLHGKLDPFVSPVAVTEHLKLYFRDLEVHLPEEIGHSPFYEDPEWTWNLMHNFIKRVLSTQTNASSKARL